VKQAIKAVEMIDGNPQCVPCMLSLVGHVVYCRGLRAQIKAPRNPPKECLIRNGNSVLVIGEDNVGIEHGGMERI
jgi:hypothetical protein